MHSLSLSLHCAHPSTSLPHLFLLVLQRSHAVGISWTISYHSWSLLQYSLCGGAQRQPRQRLYSIPSHLVKSLKRGSPYGEKKGNFGSTSPISIKIEYICIDACNFKALINLGDLMVMPAIASFW